MHKTLRQLFVNRSTHFHAYRRLLKGQGKYQIYAITAASGMGKSWLLGMFAEDARSRNIPVVHIDFADGQGYDMFTLIRRCRDRFGHEHFVPLNQAIDAAAQMGSANSSINISIGSHNTFQDSGITVSKVESGVSQSQADMSLQRQALEAHLNKAFFDCLNMLCSQTRVVFLFDTYELTSVQKERWISAPADYWIATELLERIRDQRLPNAVVVLAGQRIRPFGIDWEKVVQPVTLEPLAHKDVKEYLCKRLGLSMITDNEIERLWQVGADAPQMLGLFGDRLRQANQANKSVKEK